MIQKSPDYVYGIWQYKMLTIKKLFQSKTHLRGENNRENLGDVQIT